jgi:hypothetical protein
VGDEQLDELQNRVVAHVGISPSLAQWAIGMTLGFLKEAGTTDMALMLVNVIPGAAETTELAGYTKGERRGALDLGSQLVARGLSPDEASGVIRETIRYSREMLGKQETEALVDSVLGLREFL